MICLVDEEQNFIFFHEYSLALLRDVLEVEADSDKGLLIPHAAQVLAAAATANTVEHGASITTLNNAVKSVIFRIFFLFTLYFDIWEINRKTDELGA